MRKGVRVIFCGILAIKYCVPGIREKGLKNVRFL